MVDLCSGPHVPDTSVLKAVALTSCSRAFWRADTSKDALQVRTVPCLVRFRRARLRH